MGPTGKPNASQRAVHVLDRGALLHEPGRLVHVGGQGAARVEAGAVADHDHVLAQAAAEGHGRGQSTRASVDGVTTTSSSGILWTGEKKCMPTTRRRPARGRRDLGDGHRRGVGGEDAGLGGGRLHLGEHAPLELQVLEDRLDDEIRALEARVVEGRRQAVHPLAELEAGEATRACAALRARSAPSASPLPSDSRLVSLRRTATPTSAAAPAMPAPMRPAPTTPSFPTSIAFVPSG